VPWFPFAKLLRWPFAWWVAVAVDHASRLVVGFAVFSRRPSSAEVAAFLSRAIQHAKSSPRTVITDHGIEFAGSFRRRCRLRGIRQRLGKVGEHGSIAIRRALHSLAEVGVHAQDPRALPPGRDAK
jgi:transposase InsO family protein